MSRARHTIAAGLTAALSAGLIATLAPAGRASTESRPVEPAGFTSVRVFGGIVATAMPVALDATRPDEVWLALREVDGTLSMARAKGPTARIDSRQKLNVTVGSDGPVVVDGSGREAWVTAGGSLFQLRSGAWRHISTGVAAGSAPTVTTVVDAAGPGAYVALRRFDESGGAYRNWVAWTDGRTWRALSGDFGGPATSAKEPSAPLVPGRDAALEIRRIRTAGGQVFAEVRTETPKGSTDEVYVHSRGSWRHVYSGGFTSPEGTLKINAWIVQEARRHLQFGEIYSGRDRQRAHRIDGFVSTWTPKTGSERGLTNGLVGAAAARADTQIVIGNNAYRGQVTSFVSGFVRRAPDGGETLVSGDAGQEVLGMTVEPISDVIWALTRNGETVQMQRYAG